MPKWGYFVQNLWPKVWSNIEQHREKGEREGEAQNTTLHAKFSKKPSMFRQRMYRFSRASRKRFKLLWTDRKCGMAVFRTKFVIASKISGIDKIGHLKNLSCKKSGTDDIRKKNPQFHPQNPALTSSSNLNIRNCPDPSCTKSGTDDTQKKTSFARY